MIIDMFSHIRGPKFLAELAKRTGVNNTPDPYRPEAGKEELIKTDLEARFHSADEQCPGMKSIITTMLGDGIPSVEDQIAICRVCNDEFAELIGKYPRYILSAGACLPMGDINAAVKEAERSVTQLGLKGVQIDSDVKGELLGSERFFPLYEVMAHYDLPIWIHPHDRRAPVITAPFNMSVETSMTMLSLSCSGVFERFPNIKFITHHGGGVTPAMHTRAKVMHYGGDLFFKNGEGIQYYNNLKKFYCDTAFYDIATELIDLSCKFFGYDHVVFGADFPGLPHPETAYTDLLKSLDMLAATQGEKDMIFEKNAIRLLKLQ